MSFIVENKSENYKNLNISISSAGLISYTKNHILSDLKPRETKYLLTLIPDKLYNQSNDNSMNQYINIQFHHREKV